MSQYFLIDIQTNGEKLVIRQLKSFNTTTPKVVIFEFWEWLAEFRETALIYIMENLGYYCSRKFEVIYAKNKDSEIFKYNTRKIKALVECSFRDIPIELLSLIHKHYDDMTVMNVCPVRTDSEDNTLEGITGRNMYKDIINLNGFRLRENKEIVYTVIRDIARWKEGEGDEPLYNYSEEENEIEYYASLGDDEEDECPIKKRWEREEIMYTLKIKKDDGFYVIDQSPEEDFTHPLQHALDDFENKPDEIFEKLQRGVSYNDSYKEHNYRIVEYNNPIMMMYRQFITK